MKLGKSVRGTTHLMTSCGTLRCESEVKIIEIIDGKYHDITCKTCIGIVKNTDKYKGEICSLVN